MTARLRNIPAVSHGAPSAILKTAFVQEQPPAAAIVLTLLNLVCADSGHQISGGARSKALFCLTRQVSRPFFHRRQRPEGCQRNSLKNANASALGGFPFI
jgi:hypothetical protein